MLFQPTNLLPDERAGIGFGTVDATLGIDFSWQINGDYPVMTAFQIRIYRNDSSSVPIYSSGKLTVNCPFYGRDALGNVVRFSYAVPSAALAIMGVENGNEYKYTVEQYYMENGQEQSITQSSASLFMTRSLPGFQFGDVVSGVIPVSGTEKTFTVNYTQAQGDPLDWIRYRIAYGSTETEPIYDSGNIFGTAVYECHYDGFVEGSDYFIRATGQSTAGAEVDTDWVPIAVAATSGPAAAGTLLLTAGRSQNAVLVDWSSVFWAGQPYSAFDLYRSRSRNGVTLLEKVATLPRTQKSCLDFGAASEQGPYTYYLYPRASGSGGYGHPGKPSSAQINPVSHLWSLLVCSEAESGGYLVEREFDFRYNLDSGSVSNNNSPNILLNFTEKPTVQLAPQNYQSGTLRALSGSVKFPAEFCGEWETVKALEDLSTTGKILYLKPANGDILRVRLSGPVSAETAEATKTQVQTVTVPWVEIDDTRVPLYALSV